MIKGDNCIKGVAKTIESQMKYLYERAESIKQRKYSIDEYYRIIKQINSVETERKVNKIVTQTIINGSNKEKFDYIEEAITLAWSDKNLFPYLTDNQIISVLSHFDTWIDFVRSTRKPETLKFKLEA